MIKTKAELKDCLKLEKKNYTKTSWLLPLLGLSESSIIWRYQKFLRKWEYHYNSKHKIRYIFYKMKATRIGIRYGFHISPNNFDTGLWIVHLGSILVNKNARVGKNCCIHINTALVATNGIEDSPKVGDNCVICVGASLIGGISLKDNVTIGANAVVTKSFDESSITLAGCPAKIITRK